MMSLKQIWTEAPSLVDMKNLKNYTVQFPLPILFIFSASAHIFL